MVSWGLEGFRLAVKGLGLAVKGFRLVAEGGWVSSRCGAVYFSSWSRKVG